ncbi:MAG: 3-hydroxyacyl-ACP dehydratase FabZ [Hellea sp.]|nr:3-hydroxyacyl-ACP dehydratase FabZ [Hellea sp.]
MTYKLPMGQDQIQQYLPHRDPMLFVDRVTKLSDNQIQIESNLDPEARYFKGHFPHMPIQPGVLIIETVAQAGALLVKLSHDLSDGMFMGFSAVDSAKFKKPVYPGETLIVDVEIVRKRLPFYKFSGRVSVKDKLVATVDFTAAEMTFE